MKWEVMDTMWIPKQNLRCSRGVSELFWEKCVSMIDNVGESPYETSRVNLLLGLKGDAEIRCERFLVAALFVIDFLIQFFPGIRKFLVV